MTSLEELWVASDTLEHLPASICKLPKLRRLHVWYSKLASVPDELFSCTKLVELRIGHNPLPEAVYARLRKALPRCTIY
jgi:Leucine-rich repeat (LRR) protein